MVKYMNAYGMNWLVEEFLSQKDKSFCPFCGQELKSHDSKKLIKNINKYIVNKTNEKARIIQSIIDKTVNTFNVDKMNENLKIVYELLENEFILNSLTVIKILAFTLKVFTKKALLLMK